METTGASAPQTSAGVHSTQAGGMANLESRTGTQGKNPWLAVGKNPWLAVDLQTPLPSNKAGKHRTKRLPKGFALDHTFKSPGIKMSSALPVPGLTPAQFSHLEKELGADTS